MLFRSGNPVRKPNMKTVSRRANVDRQHSAVTQQTSRKQCEDGIRWRSVEGKQWATPLHSKQSSNLVFRDPSHGLQPVANAAFAAAALRFECMLQLGFANEPACHEKQAERQA